MSKKQLVNVVKRSNNNNNGKSSGSSNENSTGDRSPMANNNGSVGQTQRRNESDNKNKDMRLKSSPYIREFDFADFFYTPHTLSALTILLSVLLFMVRYYYYPDMSVVSSVKLGFLAAALSLIVFGAIHFPDSILIRPHPCVWRAVLVVAVLYIALLSFMMFQNLKTVRTIMGFYDPSLLIPQPEGQYAEDCRFYTSDNPFLFVQTAFDIFILAHSLGYFVKTIIVRDWRVATCISIGFEIIEITFQHVLPNFKECWWDHLLLDVLLCNAGGTLLGILALRRLRAKEFHWTALSSIKDYKGKAKRILGQFGPRSFVSYEWNVFLNPKRFLQFFALLALLFIQDINCFTMKHILHMPPKHHLVTARLLMWSLIGIPSVREYYEYISTKEYPGKRFGMTAWVGVLALLLETIFITKMAIEGGYFQEPMPSYIAVPWMIALCLFIVWFILFFGALSLQQRMERRGVVYIISNIFFYLGCGCIVALFLMGMPDLQIGRATFEGFIAPYEKYIFFWR
ncbi:phosphatidylserine synthase [Trypanosoma theileri]|uniref:Phosphatidylserine synthase n=1 Tax=Trypanosoma theileri TaxID=67003 RepID=A0A1X0NNG6_9TRYP|nr:phosphatidylserine synthase [Trypanosoma theileri]ORC86256.1 phosphatidylserine synthase [Trypanosoma theileri]